MYIRTKAKYKCRKKKKKKKNTKKTTKKNTHKNNQQHIMINHTTNNDNNSRHETYIFAARQTGRRIYKCILRLLSLKFIVDVVNEVF